MSSDINFCRHSGKLILSVREAGRLGGLAVLYKHGRDHFVEIGRLGQAVMRSRYPDRASQWGKLGGRPRKLDLNDILGGQGKNKNRKGDADPP